MFNADVYKRQPQGGIISPTLANMTLDGLQKVLAEKYKRGRIKGKLYSPMVNLVRYADDFIITCENRETLEKEQAIFKKERIRAERKIAAGQGEIEKAKRTEANRMRDLEYINSYNGTKATLLLSLPQATTDEVGRELHRIAKTYRNEAYGTVGTYAGLVLQLPAYRMKH